MKKKFMIIGVTWLILISVSFFIVLTNTSDKQQKGILTLTLDDGVK